MCSNGVQLNLTANAQLFVPSGEKPYMGSYGNEYFQLHQRVPLQISDYMYTPFEKQFLAKDVHQFSKKHPLLPLVLCVLYLVLIFSGMRIMKDRKPFCLKYKLAFWNFALSLFSFVGAARTVPHLLFNLGTLSFHDTICTHPCLDWGDGSTGLWVALFVYSKIPELGDTAFIVLRKKPLIFLHWYHHITVLLYCWQSYSSEAPQALYFIAMNYTVHAVMYGYYGLMTLRLVPKWFPPMIITTMQLSQMVVGIAVQIASMYKYFYGSDDCPLDVNNMFWGGVMYFSYFLLFLKFFLERFCMKRNGDAKKVD